MVCRECGAYNNDQLEYCKVCAAPLHDDHLDAAQYVAPAEPAAPERPQSPAAPQPPQQDEDSPAWGFVRAPRWPQPNFDMNTVDPSEPQSPAYQSAATRQQGYAPDYQQSYTPDYQQQDYKQHDYQQQDYQQSYTPDYRQSKQQPYTPDYRQDYQQQDRQPEASQISRPGSRRFEPQPMYRSAYTPDEAPPVEPVRTIGGYDDQGASSGGFGRAPQRAAIYSMDDDEDVTYAPPKKRSSQGSSGSSNRRSKSRGKSKRSNSNTLFFVAAGVLLLLILVFAGIIVSKSYGGIGNFFSSIFGGSALTKEPVIEETVNEKGAEVFAITVFARNGSTVRVQVGDLVKEEVIKSDNQLGINIAKEMLKPSTPVDTPTAQVPPIIDVIGEDGEIVPVTLPAEKFTVNVPTLSLNLASSNPAVAAGKVSISGTVDDSSVSVYVEDQALTVNADGTFQGEYELPDIGSYTLTVRAEKPGYQIARQSVSVDYSVAEAAIEFEPASLRAAEAATSVTVKGQVDPGATMSVTGPSGVTVDTPSVNAATGIFSFTATLPQAGHYDLTVTLNKEGATSTKTVTVESAPKVAEYKYFEFDYKRMTDEPNHTASYELPGAEITEILHAPTNSEPYLLAKASVGGNEVVLEYRNAKYYSTIAVGNTRRPLGDYAGIDSATGLPKIYVWFIYDK